MMRSRIARNTRGAKGLVKKMCLAANLIIYLSMINLVNNIIQMSSDCTLIKGKQVAFSVFSKCPAIIFTPAP